MTATSRLNEFYYSIFSGCANVAVAPYKLAFVAGSGDYGNALMGLMTCAFLTVVPILPLMTLVTMSIAIGAALVAALSTFVTYPFALGIDACGSSNRSNYTIV